MNTTGLKTRLDTLSKHIDHGEARGHHVSDLERSFRQWLDSLEMEID